MRPGISALCLVMLVAAGCAAPEPGPTAADPTHAAGATLPPTSEASTPPPAPDPKPTKESGSISGLVVDDEIRPIVGVNVTVEDTGESTHTDSVGRFTFNDLPGGSFGLQFRHEWFENGSKLVTVVPGDVTEIQMVLIPLPSKKPWVQQIPITGSFARGYGVVAANTPIARSADIKVFRSEDVYGDARGMLVEAVWESTGTLRWGLQVNIMPQNQFEDTESWLCTRVATSSPLICDGTANLTKPTQKGYCPALYRICFWDARNYVHPATTGNANADATLVLDQTYKAWVSFAWRQPFPPGYQARPPGP